MMTDTHTHTEAQAHTTEGAGGHAEQTQLELVSETLHLPVAGVRLAERGLVFAGGLSDAELARVGRALFGVRSVTKWALGALFAEMMSRAEAKHAREETRRAGGGALPDWHEQQGGVSAGEFAALHQVDPKEFREMVGVWTFFAGVKTIPVGDYEFCREAMWGVDDGQPRQVDRAVDFLRVAHERGWRSVTQLRRHIRSSGGSEPSEPRQLEMEHYGAVQDFRRWCTQQLAQVQRYTPERARLVLTDLGESTLSYLDALRDIAATDAPKARKSNGTDSGSGYSGGGGVSK